uniref:Uncharacterized protein n=1 Tax=Iconisemion striatum TaxID=60296 RepID=A0A1A7X1I3_9TELE
MLQQNNNNNYPCLSMSASTQDIFQKCSRTSLPFSSRLELGELPLIRGLRAWALCSRTRRRAGGLLGGGKAPVAPPLGRGSYTSCLRPADVYLSGELDRLGYRMPQGLDSRRAGIGALVTVATLKTSEGSGKTQTQCLFLRTEKGSCLYSKPGGTTGLVGDLLKGKRGGGGPDSLQAGANRVRVRSGRRWRKSGNVAGREKTAEQQKSWEDPNSGFKAEEGLKEEDKVLCSPRQDSSRTRCCHNASAKTCTQCGRRPRRKENRDVTEGESPARGVSDSEEKVMRRVRHRNEEEEEEEVRDPESNMAHGASGSICDVDHEQGRVERAERQRTQTSDFTGGEMNLDVTRRPADVCGLTVTHEKTEKPREDARGGADPDESGSMGSTASLRSKESSTSVESRVWDPDHDRSDEELNFSSFQAQELNFTAGESKTVKEEFIRIRESPTNGKNSSQQDEKGVLSPLLQQRLPSIPETGTRKPEDECTCSKVHDGKNETFKEDQDEGEEKSLETEECWNNRETNSRSSADPLSSVKPFNPAPSPPPLEFTETSLPGPETGEEKQEVGAKRGDIQTEKRTQGEELEEQREEERSSTVATEEGRKEEEEDEFGVFMQAEGVPSWSEEMNMSASVPYGSRRSTALGNQTITGESNHHKPDWTGSPFHQSHDTWAAFPQDADAGRDVEVQWWLAGSVEARRGHPSTNHNLAAVLAEAFPSPPGVSSPDSCDPDVFPTLTQLLRGQADQDQGLLDHFHDLNKMIGQSYKRVSSVSRELLLNTLHLQQPIIENRPASWTSNRRLSPGLPSANQHAHHAAAKRRLSYDFNRNVVE